MSKWIEFVDAGCSASGKTRVWEVRVKEDGYHLGKVSWYAPWRKYIFHPTGSSIYEQDCLRDIADFIELQTKLHKQNAVHMERT